MPLRLTRHAGEAVSVTAPDGQRIMLRVLNIDWQANRYPQVRLEIEAPREWAIVRQEQEALKASR